MESKKLGRITVTITAENKPEAATTTENISGMILIYHGTQNGQTYSGTTTLGRIDNMDAVKLAISLLKSPAWERIKPYVQMGIDHPDMLRGMIQEAKTISKESMDGAWHEEPETALN